MQAAIASRILPATVGGPAAYVRELAQHNVIGVWADQQPQQLAASPLRLLTTTPPPGCPAPRPAPQAPALK